MDRAACQRLDRKPLVKVPGRFMSPRKTRFFWMPIRWGHPGPPSPSGGPPLHRPVGRTPASRLDHSRGSAPGQIGDAIAHLMGAGEGNGVVPDNTTVNLYKILTYAWRASHRVPSS
ncbi:MAG: hypothetical protein CM1200mP20_03330 [Pseudomonadota bacterium]|nr:MAG: hypothetical protein CM1200mP20_03330 [Pseudomonadota bacterium]